MNNLGVKLVFQSGLFLLFFVFSPLCATILHKYKILFGGFIRKGRASFREAKVANQLFPCSKEKCFKDNNNKNIHIPRKNLMLMIIKYFFSSVFCWDTEIFKKKLPRLARVKLGDDIIIIPIIKHTHTHLSQTISCWLSEIYTQYQS